jgi:hypothetical protein
MPRASEATMTLTTPPRIQPAPAPRKGWSPIVVVPVVIALLALTVAVALLLHSRDSTPRATIGSGVSTADTRTVSAFSGVDLAGGLNVVVRVGGAQRVVVHADDNLVNRVTTEVHDGTLVVDTHGSFRANSPTYVDIAAPVLVAADVSGAGRLRVDGISSDAFTATLSGAGTLSASGRTDRAVATLSGAGTLELAALVAKDVIVTLSGTGRAAVSASTSLDATVSGTGSVVYAGHPARVTTHVSGTGSVTAA